MLSIRKALAIAIPALAISACASKPEMPTVDYVDLERFMGDWYVIANIPTFMEKGAHNAIESYSLNPDGTIDTRFSYRKDSFDGERKEYNPKGFVTNTESNAIWGMRFVWPIKADYRIVYLEPDYSITVIGRQKRDYLWIMARQPEIAEQDYARLVDFITSLGYEPAELERVPQQW